MYNSSTHAANSGCLTRVRVADKRLASGRLKLSRMLDIDTSLRGSVDRLYMTGLNEPSYIDLKACSVIANLLAVLSNVTRRCVVR